MLLRLFVRTVDRIGAFCCRRLGHVDEIVDVPPARVLGYSESTVGTLILESEPQIGIRCWMARKTILGISPDFV